METAAQSVPAEQIEHRAIGGRTPWRPLDLERDLHPAPGGLDQRLRECKVAKVVGGPRDAAACRNSLDPTEQDVTQQPWRLVRPSEEDGRLGCHARHRSSRPN
jgi:hypothetical protein